MISIEGQDDASWCGGLGCSSNLAKAPSLDYLSLVLEWRLCMQALPRAKLCGTSGFNAKSLDHAKLSNCPSYG